ncbi:MAG: nucleotidyltransferase domain-containing protein [Anaerolineales bacterium]|jgi:hypothetical protein|nr:nucleotidyltransferase domain-containing protein [Anaerolineales bacterium]
MRYTKLRECNYYTEFPEGFLTSVCNAMEEVDEFIETCEVYLVGSFLFKNKVKTGSDIDILVMYPDGEKDIVALWKTLRSGVYCQGFYTGRSIDYHFRKQGDDVSAVFVDEIPRYDMRTNTCINFSEDENLTDELYQKVTDETQHNQKVT